MQETQNIASGSLEPQLWRPFLGMPGGAQRWAQPSYAELGKQWRDARAALKSQAERAKVIEGWLREIIRAIAIETGQIEELYTLRHGVREQFIAEGFAGALGAHTLEGLENKTIRGLLEDQEAAYDMLFEDVASGRPLSAYMVKSWHQLLTRHQDTVAGLDIHGKRIAVEFKTKGQWKIRPNNPRRPDGVVHQYCPPEHVQSEMDRFFETYEAMDRAAYPVNVQAAWLHHRFVRTHPFQDGNGRVSRLLMAWPFVKEGLPLPIIAAAAKDAYIATLEAADAGDLRPFSNRVGILALDTLDTAVNLAKRVLSN